MTMTGTNPRPNNADLSREIGQLEGEMMAVKDSLDRIEKVMTVGLKEINTRLQELEAKENQRKGALGLLMVLAAALGAGISKFVALAVGG